MNYINLGNTGLRVSQLAMGCAGLEKKEQELIIRDVHYAMDKGINLIDIFASDPLIRSGIGAAIAGRRADIIIQGHIGSVWKDGQYMRTRDMELVKPAFEDLLERLGTDYIDIGMIHYVDSLDDWKLLSEGPFMEYLQMLKQQGRIRHIGLSSHNPNAALAAVQSGIIEVLMFSINPCYDMQPGDEDIEKLWAADSYSHELQNQDAERKQLYELCAAAGVGIDVMKAFGGGDLLDEKLSPFGKAFTPVQCLHYALTRPAVAAVMIGFSEPAQLDESLAYMDASDEQKDYTTLLSNLDRFTFEGHCLYCGHCAPCPVGIDVAAVTKFLNLCRAHGTVPETERGHYSLLEHHAGECIECGQCEDNCPFGVEIRENMKAAAEMFGY